jgi:hypothetical protein
VVEAAGSLAGAEVDVEASPAVLLALFRLKTLLILFTYLPRLRRRSLLSSSGPDACELMAVLG